ncbi:MAG: hypothetical protein ACK417_11935 [Bacteroidia bacterium]
MKKLLLLLLMGGVMVACKKDSLDPNDPNNPNNQPDPLEVSRVQNMFAINFSGTWCGPCGSSGIPAITAAHTQYGNKLHIMKVGFSDEFTIQGLNHELAQSYYPSSSIGIPGFGAGEQFLQGASAWRSAIDAMAGKADASAKAALAITQQVKGDSLLVKVRMKSFEALSNAVYSWTVFIIEDDLVAPQAGLQPNPYNHKFVYRGNAIIPGQVPLGVWGHSVTGNPTASAIPANTEYNASFAFVKPVMSPAVDLSKCYAYVVLNRLNTSFRPAEYINSASTRK